MTKWISAPKEINGFIILEDYGITGRIRMGRAICKSCKKEIEINLYYLKRNKGCGCIKTSVPTELKPIIHGFKIIKDLGRKTGTNNPNRTAIAECIVCKNEFKSQISNLKGRKSCGCLDGKPFECDYKKTNKRLVQIYKCMKARCYDKKHHSFHNYGNRGIKICDSWLNSPNLFCEWALSNGYSDELTIDRIDNNKGYEPENCRWVSVLHQNRNARTNVLTMEIANKIRMEDKSLTRQFIADKYGVSRGTITNVLLNKIWVEK